MNTHELPLMFDAVLSGDCPLPIFADAIEDCGLGDTADWIRRLHVRQLNNSLVWYRWYLALHNHNGDGFYPLTKPKHNDDFRSEWYTFKSGEEAEQVVRNTAILNARLAIAAGYSVMPPVIWVKPLENKFDLKHLPLPMSLIDTGFLFQSIGGSKPNDHI